MRLELGAQFTGHRVKEHGPDGDDGCAGPLPMVSRSSMTLFMVTLRLRFDDGQPLPGAGLAGMLG